MMARPRIRHNDHGLLQPPDPGGWTPELSVSVVIPAHDYHDRLDLTLAALSAQSYPAELLEVVVVDDGSTPPVRLPEIRPEHTRLVTAGPDGWGPGHALRRGVDVAEGTIIHRLDADMVACREEVELHLRWHHLADYLVVLGHRLMVDFTSGDLTPEQVRDAVAGGSSGELYDAATATPNHWIDAVSRETDGLREAGPSVGTTLVGASMSVPAALLRAAGGVDPRLTHGEDTELGYRLSQAGAVFVPEAGATSWHLGASGLLRDPEGTVRHNRPYLADLVPTLRLARRGVARQWTVPYVDVVIDANGAGHEAVCASVDAALDGGVPDVRVTLLGPWDELGGQRRDVLTEELVDARLTRVHYRGEGRVRFATSAGRDSFPVPFRFTCRAGWRVHPGALSRLVRWADAQRLAAVTLDLPDGGELGRLERTALVRRAALLSPESTDLDGVLDEIGGVDRVDAPEWGTGEPPGPNDLSIDNLLTLLEEQGLRPPRPAP